MNDTEEALRLLTRRINELEASMKAAHNVYFGTVSTSSPVTVTIDGDTTATPCRAAVGVSAGDRVVVMRRRTAYVVVANLTNPPGALPGWTRLANVTGSSTASISLTGYKEVLIVANINRNGSYHTLSANLPVAEITSTSKEVKLGGGVGASATAASSGAWVALTSTSFHGVQAYINGTSYLSSTTFRVYAR